MLDLRYLDIPPEHDRTEQHRSDIQLAWLLIDSSPSHHMLASTEGHLCVLRAIQLGRQLAGGKP